MEFQYFYGSQADQFSFIRIPKMMLTEDTFSALSIPAKVLYGVLLDRMSLSRKNGWFDEENRVFIIYQIGEIQEDLGFSKKKAMELLSELQEFGLLEKKRRGHGLPNILYVKSFMTFAEGQRSESDTFGERECEDRSAALGTSEEGWEDHRSAGNGTSGDGGEDHRSAENGTSKDGGEDHRSAENGTSGDGSEDLRSAEFESSGDIQVESRSAGTGTSRSADLGTCEVPDSALLEVPILELQEVPFSAPLKSNTNINNTEKNNIESNHILSTEEPVVMDTMRLDAISVQVVDAYKDLIRENIGYDDLLVAYPYDGELVEGIADLILETVVGGGDYILIASRFYPAELVKSKLLKLEYAHVEYVIACMKRTTTRIWNIKKYLLAALFNAPSTIGGYYQAEVNHDMG